MRVVSTLASVWKSWYGALRAKNAFQTRMLCGLNEGLSHAPKTRRSPANEQRPIRSRLLPRTYAHVGAAYAQAGWRAHDTKKIPPPYLLYVPLVNAPLGWYTGLVNRFLSSGCVTYAQTDVVFPARSSSVLFCTLSSINVPYCDAIECSTRKSLRSKTSGDLFRVGIFF